jgi:hypothetical protein
LIEDNNFYSNNFNLYDAKSDVKPAFPFPVGTGMWIAGGNHHIVRNNYFYDNWRRGTMVFSVPDALVCGPAADGNEQHGCESGKFSTSHYNTHNDNIMGQRPDGKVDRNGVDFWWDNGAGSRGNCWYRNSGPLGVTTDPPNLPDCADGSDPAMSLGTGDGDNEGELGVCASAFVTRDFEGSPCPWVSPPTDPGDGDSAMGQPQPTTPLTNFPVARASGRPPRVNAPLGQTNCADWNAAQSDSTRQLFINRVRGFVGGRINSENAEIGHGPRLNDEQMATLFDNWCGYQFSQGFVLYKLYAFSADFQSVARP